MVDDQVRALNSKMPLDERESAITIIEHSGTFDFCFLVSQMRWIFITSVVIGPIPDAVQAYIQESSVASIVAIYYTLHTAKVKDRIGLMRILGSLSNCDSDRAFEDPFLHSLVKTLYRLFSRNTEIGFKCTIFSGFSFHTTS